MKLQDQLPAYAPESYHDFTKLENKTAMETAIAKIRSTFNTKYSNWIDGKPAHSDKYFNSLNPSKTSEVIGSFPLGTIDQANEAVESASKAFQSWSKTTPEHRAGILLKAASLMKARRHEFSAMMVLEAGKNFAEAEADTAEAIDFMEFYAREVLRYAEPSNLYQMPGEKDEMFYIPIGVVIVIPPWNFPCAILAGMTVAALVTGNTVVLKPASDTPAIGYMVAELLYEAGFPHGVLNFLAGSGGTIGDTLVSHPKTRMIAFTGSLDIGLRINEMAAKVHPGQIWLKRLIAELGGKDAIIVNHDADLEAAAQGIVASAFGFQGQKCSACSRAILHKDIYDTVLARVVELTNKLTIGNSAENPNMGPVSSERAMKAILNYIEIGKTEGRLMTGGVRTSETGYFIAPTVIADIKPGAVIEQEEIFGPVLAVIKADSFDHALEIANGTKYGLTGAVYSKNPEILERARNEYFVGNLYLNRKCTGAMVGSHPFGGFNMSGTDSKAGGKDYLLLFLQAKSVATKL
ncbi:MAG: L-glutamate gamma-semialdehyde dehydrogenase [Bacteroidetes bacterium]|nr:L-glutamate gamma-semialdehyde dehydrogenase [Bacteroidota bacterium]